MATRIGSRLNILPRKELIEGCMGIESMSGCYVKQGYLNVTTARGSNDYSWMRAERKIGAMAAGQDPSLT